MSVIAALSAMNVCHCSSWYFKTDNHLNVSAGLACFKAVWRVFVNGLAFRAIWTRQTWILQLGTICLLQTRPPRHAVWHFAILLPSCTYKGRGLPKIILWNPGWEPLTWKYSYLT